MYNNYNNNEYSKCVYIYSLLCDEFFQYDNLINYLILKRK